MDTLSYKLRLDNEQFARAARQSAMGVRGLKDEAGRADGAVRGLASAGAGLGGLKGLAAGAAAKFSLLLGSITAVTSAVALLGVGMAKAADMETTTVAFETLIGSAEVATDTLAKLRKFGAETPLEFPDIAQSARLLLAFGESAGTVTESLRRVGDISSGVGANITEISEIYGKARVAGTLFAEDINQLLGRGIPVIGEFAKQLGVSESEVKKLASAGKITFPMLEQAFVSLTSEGGKFAGMMAKQSQTTKGLLSTLKDGWNDVLVTIGQPLNDALKPLLQGAVEWMGRLGGAVRTMVDVARNAVAQGKVGVALYHAISLGAKMAINAVIKGFGDLPGKLMGTLAKLGEAIAEALTGSWETAMKIIADFKIDPSGFLSTKPHKDFLKGLISPAKGATAAIEQVTQATQAAIAAANEPIKEAAGPAEAQEKKIRGYSWKKQGDAAAARMRAGAGMEAADARLAAGYKRAFPGLEGAAEFRGRERPVRGPGSGMTGGVYGATTANPAEWPGATSLRKDRFSFPGLDQAFGPKPGQRMPEINLAAPGTATRQQDRREAAASASQGEKQRWDIVQKISEQIGNLVAA